MSGFDENPFGEPNINNDPFADPAVQRAASSIPTRGIEDYNPFANQPGGNVTQVRGASNPPITDTRPPQQLGYGAAAAAQPAMLQTSSQEAPPPNYARSAQQTIPQSNSGLFSPTSQPPNEPWRRNTQDMNNPPYYARRNNWPPLPESCCVQPCFYQDIDVEIQTDFQKIVRNLYYLWIFHAFVLILNVFGSFLLMISGKPHNFGVAISYVILFTPFSFLCWFRPVYQAFKNDSSFNFMVFFFMFFFQAIITGFQSIGILQSGAIGVITALEYLFEINSFKSFILAIVMSIIAGGFVIAAVADVLLMSKVHQIYRSTGASVTKAQQEFTSTFLRNEHVQGAAAGVASSAVRAQVNNMTQPRY